MIQFTFEKEFKTKVKVFHKERENEDLKKLVDLGLLKQEGGQILSDLNLEREGTIYIVADYNDLEGTRLLGYKLANTLRKLKVKNIMFSCKHNNAIYLLEGMLHSNYHFDYYKSKKETEVKEIEVTLNKVHESKVEELKNIMDGIFVARDLINLTPIDLYPESYANKIVELFKGTEVKVDVYDKKGIESLGMKALLAVGHGSERDPRFVVLSYLPNQEKEHLTIVGKGMTYDSGGYALKPATSMVNMQNDMSGSAAVVGFFKALAANKVKKNVIGVMGLAENMISGRAYKNGDIISSMKGTTIEIGNTDAEGRLTLADSLYYAATQLHTTHIVELSTLTGACVVALGTDMAGITANDDDLYNKVHEAGILAGEFNWRLPMTKELEEKVKATYADLKNSIPGGAGTITAGIFLTHFVENKPFVHIDIAGAAYGPSKAYYKEGGYGFGVRTLYNLVDKF